MIEHDCRGAALLRLLLSGIGKMADLRKTPICFMIGAIWDNEVLSLTIKFKIQFLRMASFGFMGNLYICNDNKTKDLL